jgi:peptide/nickel transport system permease protein
VTKYVIQRLALGVPTLLGLTVLVFVLIRVLIPVDVVDLASADAEVVDPELEQRLREEFGIDGSLPEQYLQWLGGIVTGDSGKSFYTGRSVSTELRRRIPVSLELGLGSLFISLVVAIPVGLYSAARQDTLADYLARGGAILFYAIPGFWIATLVLVFGSKWFGWAPPIEYKDLWEDPGANVKQMIAPMVILGLSPIGIQIRLIRTQVLEVIRQDYIRTARAKGVGPRQLYFRHVLRNALLPLVTVIGLALPGIVAGTVIFEQVFVIPGVGRYLLDSLNRLDLFVILGTNLFFGTLLVISNIVVDVSYGFIDPRVRLAST